MSDDGVLPSGWASVRLEDLGMVSTTIVDPSKESDKEWELWSVPSFPTGRPEVLTGTEIGSTKQRVYEGDVLLCKINPRINRVWVVGEAHGLEQIASSEWIIFRQAEIDPRFLMHRLREGKFREELCAEVSGVGGSLTRARPQTVKMLRISLPPAAEQRRIVAKIEALQERSRRAREVLTEVGPLLEQFRQSVLAAAFRGDLTANWRAAHPNVEPASTLLHRIRAERRHRWEQAELAKYEAKGQKLPKNWEDKYKEPEPVDDSDLSELPVGWVWTTFGELALIDSGEAFKKKDYSASGVRLFQIANVGFGRTLWQQKNYLPEPFVKPYGFLLLDNTDIVIALNRPILDGRLKVTRINDNDLPAILYQRVGRLRTAVSGMVDYLFAFMRSPLMLQQVEAHLQGTDQPYINTSDIPDIIVPLAPFAEQTAILTIVSRLFDVEITLENQRFASLMEFDHLDQSILAKAFRGELVPQDPSDEPASVLLERIRAQRAQQAEATKQAWGNKMKKNSSRLVLQNRSLVEVLTAKGQPMPPQQLLTEAGYNNDSIEDFYLALRKEIAKGHIRENRLTESDVTLEAVKQ